MSWMGEAIRRGRPPLVSPWVGAVILGILAMHTLVMQDVMADHGSAGSTTSVTSTTVPSGPGGGHPAAHGNPASALGAGIVADGVDAGPQHDTGDMVMLCAQMLLTASGTFLVLLLHGRSAFPYAVLPRLRGVVARPFNAHAHGRPPYVWEFSVIRC